ncbi:LysR family transcriptional regulator [Shewanella maritima]|uniref:LysR family transcriptional regulator n=1 Tax=Shewanella maritima TaxID=2520507 RepID=UPI003735AEFC
MSNQLEQLDLNLLKLLKIVVETRNTSQAAEVLGVSQTSVSRGMAKLRETFGDQLFIRKAHGVEPSELAEKLAEAAENMLTPFANVLASYQNFDPLNYSDKIVISAEISIISTFGNGLYQALDAALPNATIKLVHWHSSSLEQVINREVDYMIHYSLLPLPQDIYTHHLSDIKLSLVARKDHPVLSQSSEWQDIHQLPLIILVSDNSSQLHEPFEDIFLDKGYKANTILVTHNENIAMSKLESSDAIMFSSSYMVNNNDKLACYPLPKTMPVELKRVSVSGGYLQSKRGYPLNQQIHQTVQSFFNSIIQPD